MVVGEKSVVSLFTGAMGLDLGLENKDFHIVAAVEKNAAAIKTIELNRPDLHLFRGEIENVTSEQVLDAAGLEKGSVTVVSGGPCCQSFSTVGSRGSLTDPRGGLFRDFTRIVRETEPRFFVMENVKGILSAAVKHRPLNDRGPGNPPLGPDEELGSAIKQILKELAELNYYVVFGLVNCADYGVPQNRWRVIFLGSRDGEEIEWLAPTHAKKATKTLKRWKTLKNAIGNINDKNPEFIPFPKDRRGLLERLKEGQNWSDLPEDLQQEALGSAYISWGGRSGFCRRLSWNRPAPTLTTSPIGRATTLCHPTLLRPLTVKEYAKLQQFPARWKFAGSINQKYMQIGNAVPIGLGEAIGTALNTTIKRTADFGLPIDAEIRKGTVNCVDPKLRESIENRVRKTQLHPVRLLKSDDPAEIKEWLNSKAA